MIVSKETTVRCDKCKATVVVAHDLDHEGDAGYGFNLAFCNTGWGDVWLSDGQGYGHLCVECLKARSSKRGKR